MKEWAVLPKYSESLSLKGHLCWLIVTDEKDGFTKEKKTSLSESMHGNFVRETRLRTESASCSAQWQIVMLQQCASADPGQGQSDQNTGHVTVSKLERHAWPLWLVC